MDKIHTDDELGRGKKHTIYMYIYVKIHSDSKFNTITMKSRRKAKQVTKKFPLFLPVLSAWAAAYSKQREFHRQTKRE